MATLTTRIKTEAGNYIAATTCFFGSVGLYFINENNEILREATVLEWIWASSSWGDQNSLPLIERGNYGEVDWNHHFSVSNEPVDDEML